MTPERYRKLRDTLDKRQPDLTLITEQVHKPRNVAALVRTADAVGMHEVHIVWPFERHKSFSGTAMGSHRWVEVHHHVSMERAITNLQSSGHKVFAAHFSSQAKDFREIDYTQPCAILMGNEKHGVSESTAERVDQHVTIPMMGMVESYNVSVAAAIILSEAQRQRFAAGMYDKVNLADEVYWRTFFRWAHPDVARFCHDKGLVYPGIRLEDGEIDNPSAWYQAVREGTAERIRDAMVGAAGDQR